MQERRERPRQPVSGMETLRARLATGTDLTVAPLNLSETGMCGRWSTALPADQEFRFTIELPKSVSLKARVAWQRPLLNHEVLAALTFVSVSQKAAASLRAWMKTARRSVPRRQDFIPVEIIPDDADESFTAVASDLSSKGLQINNDFALAEGRRLTILLPLESNDLLELRAQVRWQKGASPEGAVIGVQFVDPSPAAVEVLDRYVTLSVG